ncbi:MAG: ribonuclease HIII, partial [Acidaminococcaceae bacterium]|nr:ribonuclease HIII [Acidaminococcaceae bacterium]
MIVFKEYVDDLRQKFLPLATIIGEKEIQYGWQFTLQRNGEKAVVKAYYNKKNQFHVTWPVTQNQLVLDLQQQLGAVKCHGKNDFREIWAGSDESGKGDFFGPLVVAAVVVRRSLANDLLVAGVKDCKQLTDKKVLELEPLIKEKAVSYRVLELRPEYYNRRYSQVKNLNTLNASGHFHALTQVLQETPEAEGALIDQFMQDTSLIRELQEQFPGRKFLQRPRGEEDTAVAAASVLARAQFLHTMEQLAAEAGEQELPKGSGPLQAAVAKRIAARLGRDVLPKFV